MSDALYPTRLRWDAHSGCGVARHDGVSVEIHRWPGLPGLDGVSEVDYVPHVICSVRVGAQAMRDMTVDEMHDAMALLQAMSTAARDSLDRCLTLAMVVQHLPQRGAA